MKSTFKSIFFFCLLVFLGACRDEFVEPIFLGTIQGEVLFADDYTPLENVRISTTPTTSVLLTGDDGKFVLDSLPVGSLTINAKKEGYKTELEIVSVNENASTKITILLKTTTDENTVPGLPFNPVPANAAGEIPNEVTLTWEATDQDETDTLHYDLVFFKGGESPNNIVATDLQEPQFDMTNLDYGTTYYWQVIVKDGTAEPVFGEIWRFETAVFPEHRLFFTRKENSVYNLYCSNMAGSEVAFTEPLSSQWRPHLSPNRQLLAYLSNEDVDVQLFTQRPDGSDKQQVTTLPLTGYYPLKFNYCWSPTSDALLYINGNRLYKINTDGTGLEMMAETTGNQSFVEVDWRSNGDIIVRTVGDQPYESKILLCDNTGTQTILVDDLPGSMGGPKFSIDGKKMLYSRDLDGYESPDGRQLNSHIFLKDLETGIDYDLSTAKLNGTNDLDAKFSPTGAQVIFSNGDNDDVTPKNIWIMNLDQNTQGEWVGTDRALFIGNGEMPDWR
ncbi:MAG: carboxypeptidase-like regulatory domain-containing protein [Saprospiraceae bacterium]